MSAERRIGQVIGGVISNPTFILYFVIAIVVLVVAIRFMNKDKRAAKLKAKQERDRLLLEKERNETVIPTAAQTFGLSERDAKICDDIAFKIAGSLTPWYGNDDEETIIRQLNRLGGPKSIKCADFFFRTYRRGKDANPNIAYDAIQTLNHFEWNRVNKDLKPHLLVYARQKGDPIAWMDVI